ncbi:MAG: xanthine dehydrogenase family protein molybdopterin-binding subunit [Alphaproteobacteria bacterium]|nr:xanthine dehydrogenase family protein molybdopterin-binding subunit [Alphaproteobacteria bacterium]
MNMRPKIGDPVRRQEDQRLLTGNGRYSDDFNLPGQVYGALVRSPHAHARIVKIDTSRALEMPGVIAILTGKEVAEDRLNPAPHRPRLPGAPDVTLNNSDGSKLVMTPQLPLPLDRVRFYGEGVAFVIAKTVAQARDAAEQVNVTYAPLSAVTHGADAHKGENIWDMAKDNLCVDADVGNREATAKAFAKAAHVVDFTTHIQRVTGVPMEPRAAVGAYDAKSGRYTLYAGSGGVVRQKGELAKILGVDESKVRVVAWETGGNFGTRNAFYPEFSLVTWAARRIGQPVKWTCERSEAFATDYQGRDLYVSAELALDAKGRILALRSDNISNVGSHTVSFVALTKGAGLMTNVYEVPAAHVRARAVLTNTVPTNSYRSAGRPEVVYVMERLLDIAAQRHGFDRVKLRRQNMIASDGSFHSNALTLTYDGGHYEQCMDKALELADWKGFAKRKRGAAKRGRLAGIGLANYIEITTGQLRERTEITVRPDGFIDYVVGTLSSGQGHETSFVQLLTDWFGVSMDRIRFIQGDTDIVVFGGGSHSGRSMRLISIVAAKASDIVIDRAKRIAAHVFKSDVAKVTFADGLLSAPGIAQKMDLFDAARAAVERNDLPDDLRGPLKGVCDETVTTAGYPYGTHVCEVEVDPDTGAYAITRYSAVDDVGTCVNPLIVEGQTHGGIVQGVGQAVGEECVYDRKSGQLLAGSFMDYTMPRADTLPAFATHISQVPSPTNRVGVRSGGEGGTTPALGVVINALVDALKDYGVEHIEMPATPQRVWKAIGESKARRMK